MSKECEVVDSEILADQEKGFPHWESRLPARLGLSRLSIRELRADLLIPALDWKIVKKRCVWSDAGLGKIQAHLDSRKNGEVKQDCPRLTDPIPIIAMATDSPLALPILAELVADEKTPRDIFLQVYRANFLNHRLLEAHRPGTDPLERTNIKRVRVGSSANFIPGMLIPCRHLELDYYELARPCPRWRGRW